MLSSGMFSALAASMAVRSRGLPAGSPPPCLAAMVISRITLVKAAPRLASATAFFRLICFHLLWPAIRTSRRRQDTKTSSCNLQLARPGPLPVAFAPMSRIFVVWAVLTCAVGGCERRGQIDGRAVVQKAMQGVLAYPRSTLVSMTPRTDAGHLALTSPDAVEPAARWFQMELPTTAPPFDPDPITPAATL